MKSYIYVFDLGLLPQTIISNKEVRKIVQLGWQQQVAPNHAYRFTFGTFEITLDDGGLGYLRTHMELDETRTNYARQRLRDIRTNLPHRWPHRCPQGVKLFAETSTFDNPKNISQTLSSMLRRECSIFVERAYSGDISPHFLQDISLQQARIRRFNKSILLQYSDYDEQDLLTILDDAGKRCEVYYMQGNRSARIYAHIIGCIISVATTIPLLFLDWQGATTLIRFLALAITGILIFLTALSIKIGR